MLFMNVTMANTVFLNVIGQEIFLMLECGQRKLDSKTMQTLILRTTVFNILNGG